MFHLWLLNLILINFPDADVRLTRRIRRDTIEKGRDIKTVLDQVTASASIYFFFREKAQGPAF
jgi:uridine kinase